MVLSVLSDWLTTLSLIFGGCCSNAITLEQLTSQHPQAGSLITFFQFLIISLHGLPKHLIWTRYGPRFKARKVPLMAYLVQVALFYLVSLLNNAAFGYHIPMAVHIIFRSGGLIVSMVLGWLINSKRGTNVTLPRYTPTQVLSVICVTVGVILTTLSPSQATSKPKQQVSTAEDIKPYIYIKGIGILSLALVFSGFLGLAQDWTWSKYGKPTPAAVDAESKAKGGAQTKTSDDAPAWQESMFYLHFLGLPMFMPLFSSISTQLTALNASPRSSFTLPLPQQLSNALSIPPPFSLPFLSSLKLSSMTTLDPSTSQRFFTLSHPPLSPNTLSLNFSLPAIFLPLLLNTITQVVCVAGVHRLTTRVSSLTVTLVLVVRKALSLILSVLGVGKGGRGPEVDQKMMWTGAGLVLLGTIGYSLGTGSKGKGKEELKSKKE